MSRILIDGRFVGIGDSISRYTLELLFHLLEIDKENEYTLLIRPAGEEKVKKLKIKDSKLKIQILDIPHYSFTEQTKLLKYLNQEKFDLVHFTQFNHPVRYKGKFVVTIHDLILMNHAKTNLIKKIAFRPVLRSAARDSVAIITECEEVKREIIYTLRGKEDKINLIYLGIDHENFNISAKSRRQFLDKFIKENKIEHDFILYVGAWKSHKNIVRLIHGYEKYIKENEKFVHLVLAGKVDAREREVIKAIEQLNNRASDFGNRTPIVTPGPISSDADLSSVYAGAIAYTMPSLAEGFGWPPLEAMACGTPVASSKLSCMPEILGDAALYFDPNNVDDMAGAIKNIIQNHTIRQDLIKKGLEQVKKYDWSRTAEKTLAVYKKVLGK